MLQNISSQNIWYNNTDLNSNISIENTNQWQLLVHIITIITDPRLTVTQRGIQIDDYNRKIYRY